MNDYHNIEVGDTIIYRLPERLKPKNPDRLWRARVLEIIPATAWAGGYLRVLSLEEGYADCEEDVYPGEIVSVEKKGGTNDGDA